MSRTRLAIFAAIVLSAAPAFADGPFRFFPITPCRMVDTRTTNGPAFTANQTRNFTIQGVCGIPVNAKAVVLNATIIGPSTDGYITLFPSNVAKPLAANLVYKAGEPALANGAIVALSTSATNDLSVFVFLSAAVPGAQAHLALDTTGYFCKVDGGGACIP
jgi:hypothetical protein